MIKSSQSYLLQALYSLRSTILCMGFCAISFSSAGTANAKGVSNINDSNITIQLYDVVSQVLAYHPSIKEAKLNRPIADANLMASRGAFDPSIAFVRGDNISTKDNQYQSQSVDLNVPLYTGGNIKLGNRNYVGSYFSETGNNYIETEIPLLKNLITDYRRTTLAKAKINLGMGEAAKVNHDTLQ